MRAFSPCPAALQAPASARRGLRRSAPGYRRRTTALANTFGTAFRVTTFGESHGGGVGCVVDGVPPRLQLSREELPAELDRRRPGQSRITTPRNEEDTCEILSGAQEHVLARRLAPPPLLARPLTPVSSGLSPDGQTLGTPIAVLVRNKDQRSGDYSEMSARTRSLASCRLHHVLTPLPGGLSPQPRRRHVRHEVRRARSGGA